MIKQMVLDLDADRTSCSWMAANQMRLWFSSFAYLILIEVGTGHWFAPLPPPNRTGGSPASGSPVSGLLHDGD
jgi:hypothetical protein